VYSSLYRVQQTGHLDNPDWISGLFRIVSTRSSTANLGSLPHTGGKYTVQPVLLVQINALPEWWQKLVRYHVIIITQPVCGEACTLAFAHPNCIPDTVSYGTTAKMGMNRQGRPFKSMRSIS
jgi:hypothetical protein